MTIATAYTLGRDLTMAEAIILARRATFDPGQFTKRLPYHDSEMESLERWQARAVVIALGPRGPAYEPKWSNLQQALRNFNEAELDAERDPA
jgi:hypothetical protein